MYLLDYRDYSYSELYKKLLNNYGEQICYDVCDKLAELVKEPLVNFSDVMYFVNCYSAP